MGHRFFIVPGAGFQVAQVKQGGSVGRIQPDRFRQGGDGVVVFPGAVLGHPHHEPCGGGGGVQFRGFFEKFNGFLRLVALKQNGPQIDQGRNVGRLEVQQSPVQLFRGGIAFFGEGFCGALPQGFRLQLPAYRGFHAPVQRFFLVRSNGSGGDGGQAGLFGGTAFQFFHLPGEFLHLNVFLFQGLLGPRQGFRLFLVVSGGFVRFGLHLAARQFQIPGKLGGLAAFRREGLCQLVDFFLLLIRQGNIDIVIPGNGVDNLFFRRSELDGFFIVHQGGYFRRVRIFLMQPLISADEQGAALVLHGKYAELLGDGGAQQLVFFQKKRAFFRIGLQLGQFHIRIDELGIQLCDAFAVADVFIPDGNQFLFQVCGFLTRLFQRFQVGFPLFFGIGFGRFQSGDFVLGILELGRQRQVAVQQVFCFVRAVELHQGRQLVPVFLKGVFLIRHFVQLVLVLLELQLKIGDLRQITGFVLAEGGDILFQFLHSPGESLNKLVAGLSFILHLLFDLEQFIPVNGFSGGCHGQFCQNLLLLPAGALESLDQSIVLHGGFIQQSADAFVIALHHFRSRPGRNGRGRDGIDQGFSGTGREFHALVAGREGYVGFWPGALRHGGRAFQLQAG